MASRTANLKVVQSGRTTEPELPKAKWFEALAADISVPGSYFEIPASRSSTRGASMSEVSREEVNAKLEAVESRLDAKLARMDSKLDTLLTKVDLTFTEATAAKTAASNIK